MSADGTLKEEVPEKVDEDPYAYLNREDFTSEKFKVEIRGLPKHYGIGEFRKLLNDKLNLESCKIKPPKRGGGWLYVCFRNEESRQRAITTLNGMSWKNRQLAAQSAKPVADPFLKRKLDQRSADKKFKKPNDDVDSISPLDRVKTSTIPLWNTPYTDQLELKQQEIQSTLIKLGDLISKENEVVADWISSQKKLHQGLLCELKPILRTNTIEGYRNKCEFTIGKNCEGDKILIGFRLSSYAAGSTAVGPIDDLCHIPERMKKSIKIFESYVRDSKLEPFNPVDHSGYWRQVTARLTRTDDLMLMIGIHPQTLNPEEMDELKQELRTFFDSGPGSEAGVTSLYFQKLDRNNVGTESHDNIVHLSGTEYIEETLLGMQFRISPQAFFQVNTSGAEVLYQAAVDLAQPTKDTSVIDVCCGTGAIGLCFSKHCGEVLGLEIVANAIDDAKSNARKNNIDNCEFFVGKAEDILPTVIQRTTKPNVIVVVDPPRAGLHQKALLAIRRAKKVTKVIYVSCDPRAAMKNLIDLARPCSKLYPQEPWVPTKAVAVDMFPHTKHCELILCLERFSTVQSNQEISDNK